MTMQYADVNGIRIAYGVRGSGPPLVLIMGYRLSSLAWPLDFVDALAERFTVVLFDNRGTGTSDKPTSGYEISNMARDVSGLLDHLEIARANVLGYSMGGAIAQEFVRQFPDRVLGLVLCATMCGGPRAVYASPSVVRVMRELDGLKPEEIARRIWRVTYSPGYLENHRELAEDQMRREITAPTPLHAADLQYQAFAEFDCSKVLPNIKAPTLVMTGDLDRAGVTTKLQIHRKSHSRCAPDRYSRLRSSDDVGGDRRMRRIRHGIPDRCFRRASRQPWLCLSCRTARQRWPISSIYSRPHWSFLRTGRGCWQEPASIQ